MSFNKIKCTENFANTGIGECDLVPKHIVGMFLVPESFEIKTDDNIKEVLQDATEEDKPQDRIYPIHGFVEVEDNTDDAEEQTFGYGGRSISREGLYDWSFRFEKGGVCLNNRLRRYNNANVRVILIDADGFLFGRKVDGNLKGIPLELFYVPPFGLSDGDSETTRFRVRIVFKPKYLNENMAFIDTEDEGFFPEDIKGLQEISFALAGTPSASSIAVKAVASCGAENVLETFETELADDSLWKVTDLSDGSDVTITSVAIAGGVATITPDSTFPSDVTINLDSVSALDAKGIVGYEGKPLTVKDLS